MTSISNVDRIMLILRQRLGDKAKTSGKAANNPRAERIDGRATVAALAAVEGVGDRQFRRTLVQTLLAEQLGNALLNDARFQEVVTQVSDALEEDEAGKALLDRLTNEFKGRR
jgi:hypothetical protein